MIQNPDPDRLYRYVERWFNRAGKTEFPTLARTARGLRWTQSRVLQAVEDHQRGLIQITGYNFEPYRQGELFVETLE